MELSGNIVDLRRQDVSPGTIKILNGKIAEITRNRKDYKSYIIPGFVDAHIHIESSMLTPSEFARIAVVHGTVATVSDPHEIANILGIKGINYMLDDASCVPLKFYFGVPSCVPASPFETTGYSLDSDDVKHLLQRDDLWYLAEVMNYPGVVNRDPEVMVKINTAKEYSKPIDGHAPGLSGEDLKRYVLAGISTDHECSTLIEALEKIKHGMKILVREGSAAKDFKDLQPLLKDHWKSCMFCSDDKHPDDLIKGHINLVAQEAIKNGFDPLKILSAASLNAIEHYKLDVGLLRRGDPADFLIVDSLDKLNIEHTYINGTEVARHGRSLLGRVEPKILNNFNISLKKPEDFRLEANGTKINVVVAKDGQIVTDRAIETPCVSNDYVVSNVDKDILKIVVVNRYQDAKPVVGFIKNFGLKKGAIGSSVAHDSHNIIALGVSDEDICQAVNLIIKEQGGICAIGAGNPVILPLPIAGIMSNQKYDWVAKKYEELNNAAAKLGSGLTAPFMTLSFMALPVIPKLKLSDKGLFDSENFKFIDVFE